MTTLEKMGKYFGYPDCCIKEVFDNVNNFHKTGNLKEVSPERSLVNGGTGFMPCQKHAEQLIAEGKTIETLITNRICPTPFPEYWDMEALDKYLES